MLRPVIGTDGKEVRYELEDDILKYLLIWCCNILKNFVSMMKQYWFILGKKPNSNEDKWFNFVVGQNVAIDLIHKNR